MKSNKLNFIANFKWLMLFPIVLLLASIIIGAVFGLNLDYDFRNVSTFNVKFNTTVSEQEYNILQNELKTIMSESEFDSYRIERIGEYAQNGLFVQIPNEDGIYDEEIDELKTYITDNLLVDIQEDIESSVVISTSDTTDNLPKSVGNLLLWTSIAIVCILAFGFFYYLIRYNFVAGVSLVLTILFEIVMLTTVMIVARIPFNYYFVVAYLLMTISSIVITTVLNNQIKDGLTNDKYNKYSNADRVYEAVSKVFINITTFMSIISLAVFAIMFFGNVSLIFTTLSIVVGFIISYLSSLVFFTSIWSFFYNKDRDIALKKRIEAENNKDKNKSDDKIVV